MKKSSLYLCCLLCLSGCHTKPIAVGNIWDDVPDFTIVDEIDTAQFENLSKKPAAWGVGKSKDVNGQPIDCIEANGIFNQYDAWFVGQANHEIYLTFDNGYENGNTPIILDILKEKNVQAVFFVTAQYVKENPDCIQRMIDEGHKIGNHSYHHYSFAEISMDSVVNEIKSLDDLMIEKFMVKMEYLRPPKGEFTEQSLAISQALGYKSLFWSFAYYDYNVNQQPDKQESLKKCLDNAHPGAIYLLHSISDTNTAILADLIDGLRELNYKLALPEF